MLVASGKSNDYVCHKLRISNTTLCKWKHAPDFLEVVDDILRETENEVRHELRALAKEATRTLRECLQGSLDQKARWSTRVKAATRLLQIVGIQEDPKPRPLDEPNDETFL
jgi:hypothetical protein